MLSKEDMAIRLIEERARLGYTQANFAHQTNKTREQLRLYEVGKTAISSDFLAQASQLGLDVQYVITGIPSVNIKGSVSASANTDEYKPIENSNTNNIQGDVSNSVVTGAGSTVNNINTTKHVTKTIAEVKSGDVHITEEQKRKLKDLVDEIVKLEALYRTPKSAKSYQAVWGSLNAHCKVTTYKLIPLNKYDTARKYLQTWIGRLNSMKSAQNKNGSDLRKTRIKYIQTNIKKLGLDDWKRDYLNNKFGVDSLKLLNDDELSKFYRAVASKKSSVNRRS